MITYEIECEQDLEDFRGNCSAIDEETDSAAEQDIASRLDRGDVWAWCCVRVKATAENGAEAYSSWLGGCCFEDERDFKAGPYFTDLCVEAADELLKFEHSSVPAIHTLKTKNGRVRVTSVENTVVRMYAWDYAKSYERNHMHAARTFAAEQGWTGRFVGAPLPGTTQRYVFVRVG